MADDDAPRPRRRLPRVPLLAAAAVALALGGAGYGLGRLQDGSADQAPTSACETARTEFHEQLATVDPYDAAAARTIAHLAVGNASCFDPATVAEMESVLDHLP